MFKDEIGGKIMTEFCALTAKRYAYRLDDDTEIKKAKGTKKCIVKRELMFENYRDALFNDKIIIRSQQRFRSYNHKVCTEEVNKIALSSNNDKRIQTFDKVTTYPYGTNVFKVCENEMLLKKNKVICDQVKNNKDKLRMDDYLSAFMDRSKNLKSNIGIYNDKLKSINSKLLTDTHTSNFIYKNFFITIIFFLV